MKTWKLVRELLLNRMWEGQEYAGQLETGRGHIFLWKGYLLPRIMRKNWLLLKALKVRRMPNGRKPKCNLCKVCVGAG
jgi:hypothetical protein